jgi:polysaccharide biosynthesis/export protein
MQVRKSSLRKGIEVLGVVGVMCLLCSCVSKGITTPRSEIIEQARAQGMELPSVEEERRLFFEDEAVQKRRLMSLMRDRASGTYRDTSYRIGPDDEVELNVFDVPELNVTVKVRPSGYLSLPLVGAVKAGGLTEVELHDELVARLSTYVRNPQINLFVSQYGSQKVAVMGAVRTPGTFPLKKGTNSVLELLSQAGGVTEKAGNFLNFIPGEFSGVGSGNDIEARARLALAASDTVEVRRGGIEIYLDQILGTGGGIPLEIPVRGGDMVVIPEAGKIMIEGEIEKPGSYDLNQQTTLLGALAASGGITYGAKLDEIEVVREVALGKKAHLVLDLTRLASGEEKDVRLRNGDIVRVPSDAGRRMRQDTFEGIRRFINFGIGGSVNLANP